MTGFDIDMWESKIGKKLSTNANHYPTKALRMAYVNSHVDRKAYKHLTARSRIGAQKLFATAEEMFKVLQKAYRDINWKHTAMNKFQDLKMTKDLNNFWAKFQILASELDHNRSIFITELKYKLILSLFRAMAGGVFWPKNFYKYTQQCQLVYQDLKDIKLQTPTANFSGNQYQRTNTNTNTNTSTSTSLKTAGQQINCNKCSANFLHSYLFFVTSNSAVATRPTCSKATRLTRKKIAKL